MELTKYKLKMVFVHNSIIKEQVSILGMKYPLQAGWRIDLTGSEIKDEIYAELIKAKDDYLSGYHKNNTKHKRRKYKGSKRYKKKIKKESIISKEEVKDSRNRMRKGARMVEIEMYAKEHKCSVAKAMIAFM